MRNDFHIGERIRMLSQQRRIGPTELARLISTSKQNVYGIFRRSSINTELLRKLSCALEHDLFSEYISQLPQRLQVNPEAIRENLEVTQKKLKDCRKDLKSVQRENKHLAQMVRCTLPFGDVAMCTS